MNIGEASILNMLLAHATRSDHYCALVDVSGVFDAQFAAEMDADMEKLLWVRVEARGQKSMSSSA